MKPKTAAIFTEKNVRSFCIVKAPHNFLRRKKYYSKYFVNTEILNP